jgi:predicted SprT family Zn-dependent metalloprotease
MRLSDLYAIADLAVEATKIEKDRLANLKFVWSDRMTRTGGLAYGQKDLIKLSRPIFEKMSEDEQINTVFHEVCHIIQRKLYPFSKSHGWEWKSLMYRCGQKANRCHNIVLKKKVSKLVNAACGCANGVMIGPTQVRRLKSGAVKYHCKKCKQNIRI